MLLHSRVTIDNNNALHISIQLEERILKVFGHKEVINIWRAKYMQPDLNIIQSMYIWKLYYIAHYYVYILWFLYMLKINFKKWKI